ncbi:MAG: hypothetical protein Kow0047_13270 [Anaerolineae bacterium]
MDPQLHLYWGDAHTNLHSHHLSDVETTLRYARELLDFWPIAYYPQDPRVVRGFWYEDWLEQEQIEREWRLMCDLARTNNRPGEFVIFPGYEWQGDGSWGDHNVFYIDDDPPLLRVNTLPELYAEIRRRRLQAIAIPHHTAYLTGVRGRNWDVYDEVVTPFAEIYSNHGCSESDEEWIGLRANRHMGPGVSGGTIEEALDRGYRLGIICSTDNHTGFAGFYGHGLMACYAKGLTREALWEAFQARRVYGASGDRIHLALYANDAFIGDEIAANGPVTIRVRVRGSDAIDRIEVLRNNRLIAGYFHQGTWVIPTSDELTRCKLRVEAGWGPLSRDIPDVPPRRWEGQIETPEGRIVSVERCWRTPGQWVEQTSEHECAFGFQTLQQAPHGLPSEALIFELEGRPSDRVRITLEGKRLELRLTEAMRRSQVLYFPEEVRARVRDAHGIDPDSLPRPDPFYFFSHKAKIHRAIPEVGYVAEFEHVDASPPPGRNVYRVRVHQRNGHIAWSSPIWVDVG